MFFYYCLRRLFYAFLVILGATIMVFIAFHVVIDNPVRIMLGRYATSEAVTMINHELGLDRHWLIQYWDILKSAFTFDFGYSWTTKQNVLCMLKEAAEASVMLTLPAFLIGKVLVIYIALLMTKYRGTLWDRCLVGFCIMMASISILVYILIAQAWIAPKLGVGITGYERGFIASLRYILLPTLIQIWIDFCYHYRFYRTIMLDEIYQDYVRTAMAKGLSKSQVLFKHVLKNVMVPVITSFVKRMPALIFGHVAMENFFGIPGVGMLMMKALNDCDFATIKAITVVAAMLSVLFNILGDILYTLVDPRIKNI